jgi:hypothetical protein
MNNLGRSKYHIRVDTASRITRPVWECIEIKVGVYTVTHVGNSDNINSASPHLYAKELMHAIQTELISWSVYETSESKPAVVYRTYNGIIAVVYDQLNYPMLVSISDSTYVNVGEGAYIDISPIGRKFLMDQLDKKDLNV